MSIKAYVGRMGSGKTYEVVSSVILAALARGRRVVSNIAGLDYDEFCTVLLEDGVPADKIGKLVQVSHDDILKPEFWLTDKDVIADRTEGLMPGDLFAPDENWRFWEGYSAKSMPDRVMNFFRMHRHFTHPETGVSCDVALISQDVMDFSRKVRAVIEETYYMEKLTAVGSTKRYRVDVHQGGKITRKPLRQIQRSYDPRYFPLYASHSLKQEGAADAKEENIDNRGNILHGALFKVGLPLAGVVLLVSAWGMWRFFHPKEQPHDVAVVQSAPAQNSIAPPKNPVPEVTSAWRVVGYYQSGEYITVTIQNAAGAMRLLQNPPAFRLSPLGAEVQLPDGEFATTWTSFAQQGRGLLP